MGTEAILRWMATSARGPAVRFARAVAPAWVVLFLVVVQADAVVDFSLVQREIRALPALGHVTLGLAIVAGWAAVVGPSLVQALRQDEDRWTWRVPAGPATRAAGVAPVWVLAVLPLVPVGVLIDAPLALPAAAIGPSMAWASRRPIHGLAHLALAAGILGAAQLAPIGAIAGLASAVVGAWTLHRSPPAPGASTRTARWASVLRRPLAVLVARDLLCLWRLRPGLILTALLAPAPAWAIESTAVANYPLEGPSAAAAGMLVLTLASTASAGAVLSLPELLGPTLDPRRASLGPGERALALAAVGGVLLLPSLVAVVLGGSGAALRLLLHATAMCTGAAWFAVGIGRPTRADRTTFLWWAIALGLLALAPPGPSMTGATAMALLGATGAGHTLARARRQP